MKNKLAYLGVLGIVGLGGFIPGKELLLSFCSFFVFFIYANVIPDELFWENVKRSALHAFFAQMAVSVIALAIGATVNNSSLANGAMIAGLALSYAAGVIVFAFNLSYYGYKEKKGMAE